MTELEEKIRAKIPGEDTGIEIRHSGCDICTGKFCGLDCYVKDGKIIRIEGTKENPFNKGHICAKGASNRAYVYREDRIHTPLRRVGERGEGKFEPISWDEAYKIIAENLNAVKAKYSPHSVAFISGYPKWYRPFYHRFVHAFGSINFSSDDITCYASKMLADKITCGASAMPDRANSKVFLGWNYDGYYSNHNDVPGLEKFRQNGGKVIIIDIRDTPASQHFADIFLKINPGTDGALALGMAKIIIENGWADMDYVEKYTYGFEQYKELVMQYPLDKVAEITGLNPQDIFEATKLFATNSPASINVSASAMVHHINGFNTHRAIIDLSALTGNYDRKGGQIPGGVGAALTYGKACAKREHQFRTGLCPKDAPPRIGGIRFPVWEEQYDEGQANDLMRQLNEGTPYPVKAIFALGMNAKMYPETKAFLQALKDNLDFFVDVDLFMTKTAKYADIVLPCCSSLEREEVRPYVGGKFLQYVRPVIEPLYDSKPDVQIIFDLAKVMDIQDEFLRSDYCTCVNWMMQDSGLTIDDLKASEFPVQVPNCPPAKYGTKLENGFSTPSGKFEFYSNIVAGVDPKYDLDPLPSYKDPLWDQNDEETRTKYPFCLVTGARLSFAVHSRTHNVKWLRSLRPDPTVEVDRADAARLNLKDGDWVKMSSPYGQIRMRVKVTSKNKPGVLLTLPGYDEANVNDLIGRDHLDPYTGFPGIKAMRVNIEKEEA